MKPSSVAIVVAALGALSAPASAVVGAPLQPTGEELWVDRHDPIDKNAFGLEPLVAPDGSAVYSVGNTTTDDSAGSEFYRVVALDSATGEHLWEVERPGSAQAAVLSPDGSRIYLAGIARTDEVTRQDWTAYTLDSTDGTELWSTSYRQRGRRDAPYDIEVAPDGTRVYLVGQSLKKRKHSLDFTTLALDASTGDKEWVRRYDGHGGFDEAVDLAVSPDGDAVYVTGMVTVADFDSDYATLAYDATSGERRWRAQEDGPGTNQSSEFPYAVVTDGERVYVTGQSTSADGDPDWLSLAYQSSDGDKVWRSRYDRRKKAETHEHAYSLALSPGGERVFVTGDSQMGHSDGLTIAYEASDGSRAWLTRYDGPEGKNDLGWRVAASPDGERVYVTGQSVGETPIKPDFVTVGYAAQTGELEWVARYGGPDRSMDSLPTIAVQPDSRRVFVVGQEWNNGNIVSTTLAYEPAR